MAQSRSQRHALSHLLSRASYGIGNKRAPHTRAGDFKGIQDRYSAGKHGAKGACKARGGDPLNQPSAYRQAPEQPIPQQSSLTPAIVPESNHTENYYQQACPPTRFNGIRHGDENDCGEGEGGFEITQNKD